MNDRKLIALLLVILATAAFLYLRRAPAPTSVEVHAPTSTTTAAADPLLKETRADILYALPLPERKRLLQAVEFFCGTNYQRDSCLHHLITCGMPCVTAVPRKKRAAIFQDYQAARAERGLLPLPPRGQED